MGGALCRRSVSWEQAKAAIDAAILKAEELGLSVAAVVVDESGVLKMLVRMDDASIASLQVAQDKAYSSAATRAPTSTWYQVAQQDEVLAFGLKSITRLTPLGGGLPLTADDAVVGAVGVSGGTVDQDTLIASAAKRAAEAVTS